MRAILAIRGPNTRSSFITIDRTMAELLTFVLGDVFGVITLVAGIFIGFWLGRLWAKFITPTPAPAPEVTANAESDAYREQLAGMIQFTTHFSGDITKHIELLQNLEQNLATPSGEKSADESGGISSKAVELIAQITSANQRLKQRLESAEATLKTQARDLEDSLSEARTDALTGLLNRRAFDEESNRRWAHWQRKEQPYSLMLMDIDHFKQVNDRYGHDAGDKVLQEVAARLNSVMRQTDYLARIGGEELAILIPEADWHSIVSVAHKVLQAVRSTPIVYGSLEIDITMSCGLMPAIHAQSPEELLKGADEALYAAKTNGRNCGFVNNGDSLLPIEGTQTDAVSILRPNSDQNGAQTAGGSVGPIEMSSVPAGSPLDSAASELRNRFMQISQGI